MTNEKLKNDIDNILIGVLIKIAPIHRDNNSLSFSERTALHKAYKLLESARLYIKGL